MIIEMARHGVTNADIVFCIVIVIQKKREARPVRVNLRKLTKNSLTKETKLHTLSMINEQHLSK